jgi:adenosylmethionine-8-amino-7-oxononanoate aminotransferase
MTERTTRILHRHIASGATMLIAAGGRSIELIGSDGKAYIDASGGAAVSCLGRGHPTVSNALVTRINKLTYAVDAVFKTLPGR